MIARKYVIYEISKDKKDIAVICDCENSETLDTFLSSDVSHCDEWIKSDIDKVLSGEIPSTEINGNVCHVEINKETSKIYIELIEDDSEYYATCCEVNTKELRELIEEWYDKVRQFKLEHKN